MKLTLGSGTKKDLTATQIAALDSKLRTRIPQLVGWGYSPLTGELTLDFGDVDDNAMLTKIDNWITQTDSVRKLRLEFLDMIKKWEE
jgi:hypothetical protein